MQATPRRSCVGRRGRDTTRPRPQLQAHQQSWRALTSPGGRFLVKFHREKTLKELSQLTSRRPAAAKKKGYLYVAKSPVSPFGTPNHSGDQRNGSACRRVAHSRSVRPKKNRLWRDLRRAQGRFRLEPGPRRRGRGGQAARQRQRR